MKKQEETNLNADAKEFWPRSNSAAIADVRIRDINASDDDTIIKQGKYVTSNGMT